MAILPISVDYEAVEDRQSFDVIPPQDVIVAITASNYGENKNKTGHGLNFELQILDGEFKGRKLWDLLSLDNPNQETVRIANIAMKDILIATGMYGKFGNDTSTLHDIPMIASLTVEPEKTVNGKTYRAKNKIKKYLPMDASAAQAAPQATAQKPTATGAQTAKAGLPPFLANKK